jgi:hypothetical protein
VTDAIELSWPRADEATNERGTTQQNRAEMRRIGGREIVGDESQAIPPVFRRAARA